MNLPVLNLSILLLVGGSISQAVASDLQKDRRFAFLPDIFIDLRIGGLYNGVAFPKVSFIRDCSFEGHNCLTGNGAFNLTWSRQCGPYEVGQEWSFTHPERQPKISFEIIGEYIAPLHGLKVKRYLLGTSVDPNILYVFEPSRGLVGIVQDPQHRETIHEAVWKRNLLEELERGALDLAEGYRYSHIVFGQIGECEPMTPRIEGDLIVYDSVEHEP